jgi:hypothetical protein
MSVHACARAKDDSTTKTTHVIESKLPESGVGAMFFLQPTIGENTAGIVVVAEEEEEAINTQLFPEWASRRSRAARINS